MLFKKSIKSPFHVVHEVSSYKDHQDFPKELDLVRFVDYDTQFNKAFLEPVRAILNSIGWSDEKKITLESFFA